MKYFTKNHFWVDINHDVAIIGISAFALKALGGIEYLEVPPAGTHVSAGSPMGSLESAKLAVEIISPVSGVIVEVNPLAEKSLNATKSGQETDGWFCKIQLLSQKTIPLMSEQEYHEFTTKNNSAADI